MTNNNFNANNEMATFCIHNTEATRDKTNDAFLVSVKTLGNGDIVEHFSFPAKSRYAIDYTTRDDVAEYEEINAYRNNRF